MGVTKHNWLVTDAADIPRVVAEAFHVATTGRPGPVLVDFPKDVSNATMDLVLARVARPSRLPATEHVRTPRRSVEAAELIAAAERPVLYVGGGILKARASQALAELVELTGIPVVTTLMARGAFPDSHPLCLGMPGMHGSYTAVTAMQQADLLDRPRQPLRRPGDRQGLGRSPPAPRSSMSTSTRQRSARCAGRTWPIVADCRLGDRGARRPALPARRAGSARAGEPGAALAPWMSQLDEWQDRLPLHLRRPTGGTRRRR